MPVACQLSESGKLHKDSFVLLNDGNRMPVIGMGTFSPSILPEGGFPCLMSPDYKDGCCISQDLLNLVRESTKTAIDIGYRHVDGAYSYQSERAVGEAFQEKIADETVKREDLYYVSKLWNMFHQPPLVCPSLEKCLQSLQLDYIDLYLIHMPMSLKKGDQMFPSDENGYCLSEEADLLQTWEALEKCKDEGLVKSIGVSNFNRAQLERILNKPGLKHKPVCNQIECHPYLNENQLLEFCKSQDIIVVAYGVMGSPNAGRWVDQSCPKLLEDPVLSSIGETYNKTSAQVSIRYMLQRGCVALVNSFNPDHMKEDLEVFDFALTEDEMKAIDELNRNVRYWKFTWLKKHPNYPFH